MKRPTVRSLFIALAMASLVSRTALARDLSFEDRVKCQEVIERVYYSHQIGATRSFEEAVPRQVLEHKVRTYLKQSMALQDLWKTPVTAEMLSRETERILGSTRTPGRLQELYAALGGDPFLLQECVSRATLVDRLTHNFFAYDQRFHSATRAEADELRSHLARGKTAPLTSHANR
ncbi:MAG TPA: hypothetical protein VKL61_09125, partial [Candidatus Polarisedimenticolia bacterium]|nr:hypothetical protein [Candidatus Polarisedimenticolia bacterium]